MFYNIATIVVLSLFQIAVAVGWQLPGYEFNEDALSTETATYINHTGNSDITLSKYCFRQ